MKRFSILLVFMVCLVSGWTQETADQFHYKFYGRVRTDMFYNSRANEEMVDGLFFLFPKDHNYDADGEDLNGSPQGAMYVLYTMLGVEVKGPDLGSAKTSAKVEVDFRGGGTNFTLPRIRHAYVNLDWSRSSVLIGQSWHPLFGEVSPSILNLSSGAPFQPLNRSPQIRYRFNSKNFNSGKGTQWTASVLWQMQYTSAGPEGKSYTYLKNGCIPEIYLGVDYRTHGLIFGVGAEMLSISPRQKAILNGQTFKVHERVTSLSAEAHIKYTPNMWKLSAKTVLANNLTQTCMLGAFGVTDENPITGECKYTPFRSSSTWVNCVYGNKWQPGIFIGYMKNLGAAKPITGDVYGVGTNVAQLMSANVQLSYNLSFWRVGCELSHATAWYGTLDRMKGKITDTHAVSNLRLVAMMAYMF